MLTSKNSQVGLRKFKGTVLKHAYLVKGLSTLVGQGISVPNTVFLNAEKIEDALETSLKHINGALVLIILLLNIFRLLLSPIDLIHNVFELLASRLKLALRSVTNTV